MEFGSREDFRRALTELKYFEKVHGRLRRKHFEHVAQKYKFPSNFLEEGLRGLSFPGDYMISKSKWFPILYRWAVDEENSSRRLLILITRYIRATFSAMIILVLTALAILQIGFYMFQIVGQNIIQIFSWLGLPTAFFVLGLFLEFRERIGVRREDLEEHIETMKREHMGQSVDNMFKFVNSNYKNVLVAGHALAAKPAAPTMFYAGQAKVKKEQKIGRLQKVLTAMHFLPKPKLVQTKIETIPVFYAENPHLEYSKRLSKLFGLKNKKK